MTHARSIEARQALGERVKSALRKDPTLSRNQLMERFPGCKSILTKIREDLRKEGLSLPDPQQKISMYS